MNIIDISKYSESLKKCKLFKNFSHEDIIHTFNYQKNSVKSYSADDLLFIQEEHCNHLSVVLQGVVEIQKIECDGNVLTVATLKEGNVFGENLLFGDRNLYPMSVICKSPATVLHIHKSYVDILLNNNSEFLYILLRILSNKALALSSKLKQVSMKSLRKMICNDIISLHKRNNSLSFPLAMSKKEWADKLGVQRPSLSRELMNMKKEDIINYDRSNITILNLEEIENSL